MDEKCLLLFPMTMYMHDRSGESLPTSKAWTSKTLSWTCTSRKNTMIPLSPKTKLLGLQVEIGWSKHDMASFFFKQKKKTN
jgi:hypothetical protein